MSEINYIEVIEEVLMKTAPKKAETPFNKEYVADYVQRVKNHLDKDPSIPMEFTEKDTKFFRALSNKMIPYQIAPVNGIAVFTWQDFRFVQNLNGGGYIPFGLEAPIYSNPLANPGYSVFPWEISNLIKDNKIFWDDLAKKYSADMNQKIVYFDENWSIKNVHHKTGRSLYEQGHCFSSTVARNKIVYSKINPYFAEHSSGANKAFDIPKGEAFGIEIEMFFAPNNAKNTEEVMTAVGKKLQFSHWMNKNYPGWICERDGSLEDPGKGNAGLCGLELVSPPMTYLDLLNQLPEILKAARSYGAKGYIQDNEYFGIHVTSNMYYPNYGEIADRIIYLVNNEDLRPFWRASAHRNGDAVNTYCPFQDNLKLGSALKYQIQAENHYRSIYPRQGLGGKAIEWRIFRSTVATDGVCAILELVKLTQDFCAETSLKLSSDVLADKFATFIKAKATPNFMSWAANFNGSTVLEIISKSTKKNNLNKFYQ
jgi:hypothetical protein